MTDEELFEQHRPRFADFEAKNAYDKTGMFVSVDGREGPLGFCFMMKFATQFGAHGPFLLNKMAARALCQLLIDNGFGPAEGLPPTKGTG